MNEVEDNMIKELPIAETFFSIQGEATYTGYPMLFIRTFGCNFTCSGFNKVESVINNDKGFSGCDTPYSWQKEYKKDALSMPMLNLLDYAKTFLPANSWNSLVNIHSGIKPIICFTGGEPTLHQKQIGNFFDIISKIEEDKDSPDTILFETNCSIPFRQYFIDAAYSWLEKDKARKIIWANSPKLSNSGEQRQKAIRPDIYHEQLLRSTQFRYFIDVPNQIDRYLKFVSDGTPNSFEEIKETVIEYKQYSENMFVPFEEHNVWVMPEGHTSRQLKGTQKTVAELCLEYGYKFCSRTHVHIWENSKGT